MTVGDILRWIWNLNFFIFLGTLVIAHVSTLTLVLFARLAVRSALRRFVERFGNPE